MSLYWDRPAMRYQAGPVDPADYNYHRSNARLVPWPNYDEILTYLELNNYPRITGQDSVYPRPVIWALDSAISWIADHYGFQVRQEVPPVEWCVSMTEGLSTILSAGVFTQERVGAAVSGSGIRPGTVLEQVASPTSAFLSTLATRTTGEEGAIICVAASPSACCSDEPALVPPEVHLAALMLAALLYKRRQAVEGVIGSSELGGIIRYSSQDPQILALLSQWYLPGLA